MRCDDMQGLLAGLIAGDLTPAQEEFVRIHLNDCPQCQAAYHSLRRTQDQLSNLDADYRPHLTGRINQVIARQRRGRTVLGFLGRSLRTAGALAMVAAVIGLVLWQRGPLQQSAARPPAQPVYLLAETDLARVEAPGRPARIVGTVEQSARLIDGGLLWSGEDLYRLSAIPGANLEPAGKAPHSGADALLAAAGSLGRIVSNQYLADSRANRISVTAIGGSAVDPHPKEGKAYQALLSPDGARLYLLAQAGQNWFVKVIETEGNSLANAHLLTGGFGADSTLLLSPAGDQIHVVDQGRLLTIDLTRSTVTLDKEVAGLTGVAVLSPGGEQILTARPEGGLALVDVMTGRTLRQSEGQSYAQIVWKGPWAYGLRPGALDLIDPALLEVRATTPVPPETRQFLVP